MKSLKTKQSFLVDGDLLAHRRGSVLVLAALLMVAMLGLVAFTVDVGYIVQVDTELQRTADASVIAAIRQLPDKTLALTTAQAVAISNRGISGPELAVNDVVFGTWDRDTGTFSTVNSGNENAVQVTVQRTAARGNALSLFFAPMIGVTEADVTASAIAMYDNDLCGPLIGIEWVSVPGTPSTDSYRSSDGTYASQTPRDQGSICSDGPITVEGTAIVNGDANGSGDATLSGGGTVTGSTNARERPLNLPAVDASGVSTVNDNGSLPTIRRGRNDVSPVDVNNNFVLDGGRTYTMPGGEYYFNDFTLTGSSELYFDGPTTIYIDGNLDTSGGDVINQTQLPNNLRILMTGGTADVTSNVDFYGVVYAPNTAVTVAGSGQFYGAAVGRTLEVTGTGDVHYDENLDLSDKLDLPPRVSVVQ